MPEDPLLTVQEVATYLHVSDDTVLRLIQDGTLRATKPRGHWRILRLDVEKLVAKRANGHNSEPSKTPQT